MRTIRWGILGPGHIAEKFADALLHTQGASLEAVASRDPGRSAAFSAKFGVRRHYDSYEKLAEDREIDVIYIATPHGYHLEHALLCLQRGKPVLCEKPMALSFYQAEKMIETARLHGVFLMEAMWTRFLPVIRTAERLIAENQIGPIKNVRADFCFKAEYRPESRLYDLRLGGGSLLDVGVYPISLCLLLLGVPQTVKAIASLAETGADQVCQAIMQFSDGRSGQMISGFSFHSSISAEIAGEEGIIHLPGHWYRATSLSVQRTDDPPQTIPCMMDYNGFEYQIREVMDCLRQGLTESPLLPHAFTLNTSRVMDIIRLQCGIHYPTAEGETGD
ncbi:MAG TPA: Gfo/Idh/MocA family oxidoreductase [Chitinophagaceae bacterium]|nr:Gfo/Idh/MocA family oxidoreductase [Chitinophagaceae bacterium]